MKKKLFTILGTIVLAGILLFATPVRNVAFQMFDKVTAGLGQQRFTDEVTVVDQKPKGHTGYMVWVQSNALTQADHAYIVKLYMDDELCLIVESVGWLASEIPGVTKKVIFTELPNMAAVTSVDVEITP